MAKAKANTLIFKDAEKTRDSITKKQQREIAKLYEQWAEEIGKKAERFSKKTNPSAPLFKTYLEELKKQLEASRDETVKKVESTIKSNMQTVADSVVKSNTDWLSKAGFSKSSVNAAFSYVPADIVEKLVTGNLYEGGWSLSKAIWGDSEKTMSEAYKVVAGGLAKQQSVYEIAKDLEQFISPSAKKKWNLTDKDGRRIYPKAVDYSAQRLARTLTQHAYQQSFQETTKDNPFITKYRWNANGSRACKICKERDGKIFDKDKLPLDHPNGMCTMEPVVMDEEEMLDELAAWVKGKDGDYPEIDKFAKKMGYKPKTGRAKTTSAAKSAAAKSTAPKQNVASKEKVKEEVELFVGGGYGSVRDAVSDDVYDYLVSKQKKLSGNAWRIEKVDFTLDKKIGFDPETYGWSKSEFEFDKGFRSFTKDEDALDVLFDSFKENGDTDGLVLFELKNGASVYDLEELDLEFFSEQKEVFAGGKFKVVDIGDEYIDGIGFIPKVQIEQVSKEKKATQKPSATSKTKSNKDTKAAEKKASDVTTKTSEAKAEDDPLFSKEFEPIDLVVETDSKLIPKVKYDYKTKSFNFDEIANDKDFMENWSEIASKYGINKEKMPEFIEIYYMKGFNYLQESADEIAKKKATQKPSKAASATKKQVSTVKEETAAQNEPKAVSKEPTGTARKAKKVTYKTFKNPEEAHEWTMENAYDEPWWNSLDKIDQRAITWYTGHGYEDMNKYLRGISDSIDDKNAKAIERVSDALSKTTIKENVVVARGMGGDEAMTGLLNISVSELEQLLSDNPEGLVGMVMRENGFLSTTVDPKINATFKSKYELKLNVPAGTHGAYIAPVTRFKDEHELLLDKGTAFRIDAVKELPGNKYRITATVVQ